MAASLSSRTKVSLPVPLQPRRHERVEQLLQCRIRHRDDERKFRRAKL